jgi:hypothetical protein
MVAFLPEYTEFQHSSGTIVERNLLGRRVAREAGVEIFDLTSCVEAVAKSDRFTTGWHYTAQANGAVARCLRAQIMKSLAVAPQRKSASQ